MRLNLVTGGDILLDDESLLAQSLEQARRRVSLIPQESALFSGSVRFNLDPFGRHSDAEIWGALEDAGGVAALVRSLPQQLNATVAEGGSNFSVGERQLLGLGTL